MFPLTVFCTDSCRLCFAVEKVFANQLGCKVSLPQTDAQQKNSEEAPQQLWIDAIGNQAADHAAHRTGKNAAG